MGTYFGSNLRCSHPSRYVAGERDGKWVVQVDFLVFGPRATGRASLKAEYVCLEMHWFPGVGAD